MQILTVGTAQMHVCTAHIQTQDNSRNRCNLPCARVAGDAESTVHIVALPDMHPYIVYRFQKLLDTEALCALSALLHGQHPACSTSTAYSESKPKIYHKQGTPPAQNLPQAFMIVTRYHRTEACVHPCISTHSSKHEV